MTTNYKTYHDQLMRRFWTYRERHFSGRDELFDPEHTGRRATPEASSSAPPVFLSGKGIDPAIGDNSLLLPAGADDAYAATVVGDRSGRHYRFASMSSSQALARSVFGNIRAAGRLDVLTEVRDEQGRRVFCSPSGVVPTRCKIEVGVGSELLGEPVPTSLDVRFTTAQGAQPYTIAVECKLTEQEVGKCSMGKGRKRAPICSGDYLAASPGQPRCVLTREDCGAPYWDAVPALFGWSAECDHKPCPLRDPFQLVRNVLASCMQSGQPQGGSPQRTACASAGHAVLVFDASNPEFQSVVAVRGLTRPGKGWAAFEAVSAALGDKDHLLRRCSWQQICAAIVADGDPALLWLVDALQEKYGLAPSRT